MQAAAGWCGETLCTGLKPRSQLKPNGLARRESLELGRPSFETTCFERALSCGALPETRIARGNQQQVKAQRGQVTAATVVVRQVEQEATDTSTAFLDDPVYFDLDLSEAQKLQLEQDRVSLESLWQRKAAKSTAATEGHAPEVHIEQQSVPQEDEGTYSQQQQRELLVAHWKKNRQPSALQKRQSAAFTRSHSSRRARRRSQLPSTLRGQHTRQQELDAGRSSFGALSPDEQLLEKLRMPLRGGRPGASVCGIMDPNTPVLTKQQEASLATIVRRGVLLEQKQTGLQDKLGRAPTPAELQAETAKSPAEFAASIQLASEGRQLMLRYNLRLVYSIAKQHLNKGMEMDDMLPEGVSGLEKAIEKFEPEKGFRFSTYSHWWIRQHIHRALVESRIIRLPVNVVDNIARISNARRKLGAQADRHGGVTDEELSSVLGLPLAKVKQLLQLSQPIKSLDQPIWQDEDGGEALHESIAARVSPEDDALGSQSRELVESDMTALLQTLPVRERNVIRWRYGLWPDGKSLGLNEVGAAYGLTQERIRQIEESGLAHLRERSPAHIKKWLSS